MTAIDDQLASRHECGFIAGEEGDGVRNIVGGTRSTHRGKAPEGSHASLLLIG
jgi:hypothetical protein